MCVWYVSISKGAFGGGLTWTIITLEQAVGEAAIGRAGEDADERHDHKSGNARMG